MDNFNLDHDRQHRLGFPEVVYGAEKSLDDLIGIVDKFETRNENVLVTKLQPTKATRLHKKYSGSFIDPQAGIFMLRVLPKTIGHEKVAILSGGTSDSPIVNEAYYTLAFMGISAVRINDIGVAGIHRFLNKVEELKSYSVLIVVAGFEGALPTVVGGMLPQPIIAVPSSVGYGIGQGGTTALKAMLSSCANGITVVNIDNGYGAAMAAVRILNSIA